MKRIALALFILLSTPGARTFDDSASDFLDAGTAAVTAAPFTACGWFRTDDETNGFQSPWAVGQAGTDNFWRIRLRTGPQSLQAAIEQTGPSVSVSIRTTNTWSQDTWHCWCFVEASATDHRIFLDGAGKKTSSTSVAPKSVNTTEIGRSDDGSPGDHFSGDLGHTATWDVVFADDEVATVCDPNTRMFLYRIADQTHYWPINVRSTEIDIRGSIDLTVTGTAGAEEPPIPNPILAP